MNESENDLIRREVRPLGEHLVRLADILEADEGHFEGTWDLVRRTVREVTLALWDIDGRSMGPRSLDGWDGFVHAMWTLPLVWMVAEDRSTRRRELTPFAGGITCFWIKEACRDAGRDLLKVAGDEEEGSPS